MLAFGMAWPPGWKHVICAGVALLRLESVDPLGCDHVVWKMQSQVGE